MSKNYPHLDDTEFPDLPTVDVYKYRNDYDYTQYQDTVKIKLMNVPWCGDYENVVYFETREERDKWFSEQDGMVKELSTMFRLYSDGSLKVDIPIDDCMKYNYAAIDYGKLPNQDALSGNHVMYYFISDMIQQSVNTTQLSLALDYWTCYIYDMGITYVNLLRGHAPMAETDVESYLSNPLDNSELLLAQDVNFGSIQRASHIESIVFNSYDARDITLGFQTNASMQMKWEKDGNKIIPAAGFESSQAFSSVDPFILDDVSYWEMFRENVMEQCPQFFETVKGMFIIPKKLVTYYEEDDFEFCGIPCHFLASHNDIAQGLFKLTREKFGFSEDFGDLAKLYTFPYSAIEVNDFKGGNTLLKVEDTSGSLEVHTMMCDMYPYLSVEAYMLGIGGVGQSTVRFQNNFTHTMSIGGRYYDFATKWSIPVFSVQLEVEKNWELNSKIGADANIANTSDQIELSRQANDISNEKMKEITANNQNAETAIFANSKWYQNYIGEFNKILAGELLDADIDYGSTTVNNNNIASIAINGYNSITDTAVGLGSALMKKDSAAGAETVVGMAQSIVNTGVNVALSNANFSSLVSKDTKVYNAYWGDKDSTFSAGGFNYWNWYHTNEFDYKKLQVSQASIAGGSAPSYDISTGGNSSVSLYGSNNYIIDANNKIFENYKDTSETIAARNYDAKHAQTLLTNPPSYGQLTGTPDIISKPFGLSFNVVTQSKSAIRQAAEQFMRYGYMLNLQWKVGSFNVMPRFSYWQCDTVYCNDNGVYEGAQEMIKSILGKGVTVWRKPDDIGKTSIYENR